MADNIVEYILGLKDEMSPKLDEATNHVKKMEGAFGGLKETVLHTVEALGVSFAIFKGMEFIGEAREYVEKLDKAEANLANTMQNMGNYSKEAFEKATGAADALYHKTGYAKDEILGLQAQLGLLGNVSEEEMGRIEKVSADFAAKFGGGIQEAGNMLAKAINNPEMARRLGMQLKIDPAVMEHIQNLAKHGKEAQARLELLKIAEEKVGGAAEAMFNADPLARFNVAMTDVKETIGKMAIETTEALTPALESFANILRDTAKDGKEVVEFFKNHKTAAIALLGTVASLTAGYLAYKGALMLATFWEGMQERIALQQALANMGNAGATVTLTTAQGLLAVVTSYLTGVQATLNATMLANPIFLIVAGVTALGFGIYALIKHFGGFQNAMSATWEMIKAFGSGVAKVWWGVQEAIVGGLTLNPELIKKGVADSISAVKEASDTIKAVWNNKDAQDAAAKNKGLVPGKETEGKKGKDGAAAIIADPKTKATGQKNVNIHIAINGGLIHGDFKIVTNKLGEGLGKVKDMVAEALTGAINDSQIVATN